MNEIHPDDLTEIAKILAIGYLRYRDSLRRQLPNCLDSGDDPRPYVVVVNDAESGRENPALLQVFVNTVLGETWAQQGEAPEWNRLYDRREEYTLRSVPADGLFLTAGVDVQRDRIEVQIVAWGLKKESWLVDYIVLDGNTSLPNVWSELSDVLNTSYRHVSGVHLGIVRMAVDSGYATQEVYSWARKQGPGRVLVVKGLDHGAAAIGQPSAVEVGYGGKKIKRGTKVWPVSTAMLKSELYGWLKLERPTEESSEPFPPGYCHFPAMAEEFFKQLTAEQLMTKIIKGYRRSEWVKTRERNVALDTRIYARAAAAQFGMDRFQDWRWQELQNSVGRKASLRYEEHHLPPAAEPPNPPRPTPLKQPRQNDWFGDRGRDWFVRR